MSAIKPEFFFSCLTNIKIIANTYENTMSYLWIWYQKFSCIANAIQSKSLRDAGTPADVKANYGSNSNCFFRFMKTA